MTTKKPAKKFTSRKPPLDFEVDDEQFMAYAILPARTFAVFADKVGKLSRSSADYRGADKIELTFDETVTTILDSIELALPTDSAERLAARISDPDNPVDLGALTEILEWLLQEWGLAAAEGSGRPTKRQSASSSGSAENGDGSEGRSSSTSDTADSTS